jgi:bacterioferritin-associated ferredoxin
MTQIDNPLRKYFRQPVIHLRLPSGGKFYPPGALDLPPNGEVPILPMTAVDEVTSRTPDALFNGSAVVNVLSSCVPNIKNAWTIPAVDFNALLAAVRIASYGHEMEIGSTCPKCGETHQYTVDLRSALDQIRMPDYDTPAVIGDLSCYFVPMTYQHLNEVSQVQFEDQKLMQVINSSEATESEKMHKLGEAFKRITYLTIRSIAQSIGAIKSADLLVTDTQQIEEFLVNAPKDVFNRIKEHAIKLREATELAPVAITCNNCQNEYKQEFTLDMSNFFETAS